MGAFPFADQDMAIGVQDDDADANMGTRAGGGGHDSVFQIGGFNADYNSPLPATPSPN